MAKTSDPTQGWKAVSIAANPATNHFADYPTIGLDKDALTAGMPEQIAIWSEGSPAWDAGEGVRVIARYPETGILASGWLLGDKYVAGKAALIEARQGSGRIILFGMRPQFRAQSYQTFKLFFNALSESGH